MRVEQIMSKQVQCCHPEDTLADAAKLMWDNDCGCLPVCSGDGVSRIAGMITDRDITMCAFLQGKPLADLKVSDAMAREVRTCHPKDTLADIEIIMREGKIRRLPVVDDEEKVVGIIALADLAQEAVKERDARAKEITDDEVSETLASICARRPTQLAA